jgi:O-antigen ligase
LEKSALAGRRFVSNPRFGVNIDLPRHPTIKVSLGLLALMVSGPFLLPFHTEPIPSFWNEWWAGALGLAAAVAGLFAARDRLRLSPLLLVPALLLAALLLQFALGRLVFPQLGLLYAVYLLWAGLLLVLGRYLADALGLARLADVLAAAIVLGALLGAIAALMQWLGVADRVPGIFSIHDGAVYGNLGQRNHHAHYSWLGMASALYLHGRGRLSRVQLWFLLLLIGSGSVLGGSRSVFFYALVLLAATALGRQRDPHGPAAKLMVDASLLLPVLAALNFLGVWASPRIPEFWAWLGITISGGGSVTSGVRLFTEVSGPSVRLSVMRAAWSAFAEHPWLGQGAGNYPWASFVASVGQTDDAPFMVAEHAHNLVIQLLAEFGAPVAVAVILLLVFWAKLFFRRLWRLEHAWCAAVLGIGAVHSLLEYPLWYSYFLGPTALLLGATDNGKTITLAGRRVAIYLALVALAGTLILGNLRADYAKIEAATYLPLAADPDRERAWRITMDRLLKLHRESLLSPWVLMAFTNLSEPSRQMAQERADLCVRGIRFAPARSLATRCAMQLAIAGHDADARKLVQDVLRAFPAERAATIEELKKGAQTYPEIEPLWAPNQP